LNSPVGRLARTLISILEKTNPTAGGGIPDSIRPRLDELLGVSSAARDYSISELASSLTWLHHIDPKWTKERLIPLLDPTGSDAEPAWSGYQYDREAPPPLFALVKPHLLSVFPALSGWRWDDGALRHFSELVVLYCFWRQSDERYLSYAEARALLQQSTDIGRSNAAWMLARILKAQHVWKSFGKEFLLNAWPRERRFQTSSTSTHLAEAARSVDGDFPEAANTLLPFLVPLEHPDVLLHDAREASSDDGEATLLQRFPDAFLALIDRLIGRDSLSPPYGLGTALQALAEAAPTLRQDPRWRRLNEIANRS
jgi:hypothetical protein